MVHALFHLIDQCCYVHGLPWTINRTIGIDIGVCLLLAVAIILIAVPTAQARRCLIRSRIGKHLSFVSCASRFEDVLTFLVGGGFRLFPV